MNRKSFLKSLGVLTAALTVAPKLLIDENIPGKTLPLKRGACESGSFTYEELRAKKLREYKMELERAYIHGFRSLAA